MPKKIVLAYSGGLDTSVIMRWLKETYSAEVIAFCADVGQGEDLEAVRRRRRSPPAPRRCYVVDLREEFVRDFVFPALRADAAYEQDYLMGTSLARPLHRQGADGGASSRRAPTRSRTAATGKGNDQVRFELGYYHFDPHIQIIAPWRIWRSRSRARDLIAYTKEHSIPVEATADKPYSIDRNLFHTSYEGGILEDPWSEPDAGDVPAHARSASRRPTSRATSRSSIEGGTPVAIDGEKLAPAALLAQRQRDRAASTASAASTSSRIATSA